MTSAPASMLSCSNCGAEVSTAHDYCQRCGGLFKEHLTCSMHSDEDAEGVCVICRKAMCGDCGTWVNDVFLCSRHEEYDIFQDYAGVARADSDAHARNIQAALSAAGLHPVVRPRSTGTTSMTDLQETSAHARGLNVMVPFAEVPAAEAALRNMPDAG